MTNERTAEQWQAIALYLADCHAATAEHESVMSRTSVRSAQRQASICKKARAMIDGSELPPMSRTNFNVCDRLDNGVRLIEEKCKKAGDKP